VKLQTGTAGNSTIYTNNTSANVNVTAPLFDYVDNDNSDEDSSPDKGTHSNFTAQQYSDLINDTLTEADQAPISGSENFVDNNSSNADGHTGHGTSSNFTAQQDSNPAFNDTLTEAFTENTTAKTNAFIAYRDSTTSLNTPKERTWIGESVAWDSQGELATSDSEVRFVRVAYSPIAARSPEKIVVTLSLDGYLDAYVWNGASWAETNNIGFPGTTATAYRCFDVAYEKTTGRALIVYSRGTTSNEIGYNIWTYGSGWGGENLLDLTYTSGIVRWLALATAPGTRSGTGDDDEIAMIYLDANTDVHGYAWNGTASAWSLMGASAVWDGSAAIATEECIAVAYEQTTGEAMFIWADLTITDLYYKTWDGTTLLANTLLDIAGWAAVGNWVTLKADPSSDDLFLTGIDGGSDLDTAYWSGSAWTVHTEHDASVDTNARRCADFAWEPTGGKGLLVWGTRSGTAAQITYRNFTAPNTWNTTMNVAMGSGTNAKAWVQLRTNPRNINGDVKILGAVAETTALDLGGIGWDGTTFTVIGASTFSANINVVTYECFEMEFMNFGPPNYELDYEFQWTTADFDEGSEQLCIRTNSLNTETLGVQVYNGGWTTIIASLTINAWNNVSISTYLTSATITFRFLGGIETSDTTQSTWIIECNLIHVWSVGVNYELDLEEQFTSADYSRTNEELCIRMGAMNGETLSVQWWNATGSSWLTIIASLTANDWNNVSVTSYLTSATFTIRYKGGTETGDTNQDSWQIDAALLHVWTESTYDHVLQVVNQVDDNWTINLQVYDTSNIVPRLLKTTISFHDGTSSDQIIVNDGAVTQTEGPPYSLTGNATVYISMSNLQSINAETSYLYVYLKIRIPNTTTYLLYVITFEVT
jgi:hypothetical protein